MRKNYIAMPAAYAAAATLTIASTGSAAVIVQDGFEYPDQPSFEAVWAPIGTVAPQSAVLDSTRFASGTKSVTLPASTANGQYRNRRTFTDTTAISTSLNLEWSFDFFESANTSTNGRTYANLQDTTAPGGTSQLISMGINNNQTGTQSGGNYYMARILGYTVPTTADPDGGPAESVGGAGTYFKLNDFGVGLRSAGFHNLKVVLSTDDGLSTDFSFFVDGQLAERVSNVGTAAAFRQYDNIALGSGLSSGGVESGYDNMLLQTVDVVPEPTSILALGGAGLLLGLRRRG